MISHSTPEIIRDLLTTTHTWAVVGCSADPDRDSNRVAAFLQSKEFRVIPVNPSESEILGERCYPSVEAIPADIEIDVVDIFRRSDQAGFHVDEAINRHVKGVWMQLGVIDPAAANRAEAAGLQVVMDHCPAIELPKMTLT